MNKVFKFIWEVLEDMARARARNYLSNQTRWYY